MIKLTEEERAKVEILDGKYEKVRVELSDYLIFLGEKYNYNPREVLINHKTGEVVMK
jgi:hypothetical protein